MIVKFITMKGTSNIAATPYYVGLVQNERTMSRQISTKTFFVS